MSEIGSMEAALRAQAEQERRLTPEQRERRRVVDERNRRLQEIGVRPVDGINFGKRPGGSKRGAGESAGEG